VERTCGSGSPFEYVVQRQNFQANPRFRPHSAFRANRLIGLAVDRIDRRLGLRGGLAVGGIASFRGRGVTVTSMRR
jgi:hypothetical protein